MKTTYPFDRSAPVSFNRPLAFALLTVLALTHVTLRSHAQMVPVGAFLRRPAVSAAVLRAQLRHDRVVADRYARVFNMEPRMLTLAFAALHRTRLKHDVIVQVHYVHPGERLGYRVRHVRKGTLVFALADGTPILALVCGNPLRKRLPPVKPPLTITPVPEFTPDETAPPHAPTTSRPEGPRPAVPSLALTSVPPAPVPIPITPVLPAPPVVEPPLVSLRLEPPLPPTDDFVPLPEPQPQPTRGLFPFPGLGFHKLNLSLIAILALIRWHNNSPSPVPPALGGSGITLPDSTPARAPLPAPDFTSPARALPPILLPHTPPLSNTIPSVPEPDAWVLLATAAIMALLAQRLILRRARR